MSDPVDIADWRTLAKGSADQRHAFQTLSASRLMDNLAEQGARLAGTFPLDLVVPGSDLDILIHAPDPAALVSALTGPWASRPGFTWRMADVEAGPALVVAFTLSDLPIEIFAHPLPVVQQMGWRHMVVEDRLLRLDPGLGAEIRALKRAGMKTEPAFAQQLRLPGDPYLAILDLERRTDSELCVILSARRSAMCQTP